MRKIMMLSVVMFFCNITFTNAQVAINLDGSDPDNAAMLDVKSSSKGLLIPRLTTSSRNSLTAIASGGLMVYDTDLKKFFIFNDSIWKELTTGNIWTENSSSAYLTHTDEFVGIGTANPIKNLHVVGADSLGSILIAPDISTIFSNKSSELLFGENRRYYSGMSIRYQGNEDRMYFYGKNGSTSYGPLFTIKRNGGVAVNTYNPLKDFQVTGSDTLASLLLTPDVTPSGGNSEILFAEDKNYIYGMSIKYDGGDNRLYFMGKSQTLNYGPYFTIERSGNVGVGITDPSELFHVAATGDNVAVYIEGEGRGTSDASLISKNTSVTGGNACYFESNGNQTTTIIRQYGSGAIMKLIGPGSDDDDLRVYNDGTIEQFNDNHVRTIRIDPSENGTNTGGQITLYGADGAASIQIDGDYNGNGRVITEELQILGGSDLSEFFNLTDKTNIQKGMVVSIDPENPGQLKVSQTAYDKKVAGIVSGANNIKPGLIMSQKGTVADGDYLVALSGRVYCKSEAVSAPIEVGDFLTTSDIPGYAMKVNDFNKAKGAILGKAMTSLKSGKGLVLVLITLQ
jgi:hypothetical protein